MALPDDESRYVALTALNHINLARFRQESLCAERSRRSAAESRAVDAPETRSPGNRQLPVLRAASFALHSAPGRKETRRFMDFRISGERISVNVPTWAVLQARVAERLAQRQGFALATLNLDHLVKLRASPHFRSAYASQQRGN